MPARTAFETSAGGLVIRVVDGSPAAALIGRTGRVGRNRRAGRGSTGRHDGRTQRTDASGPSASTGRTGHTNPANRTSRPNPSPHLRWSMPKGHVEAGESLEQTAVREVAEETGITGHVVASLGHFSYTFTAAGRRIHKRVHHFLLEADSGELSDADVEVTEVAWVPIDRLGDVLAYAAERRIARRAVKILTNGRQAPER